MRKLFLPLSATLLMLASCSSNQVDESTLAGANEAIKLDIYQAKTKATDAAFVDGNGFKVYATYKDNTSSFAINGTNYKNTAGFWSWEGSNLNWPTDVAKFPMNFYAAFPSQTLTYNATPSFAYTVNSAVASQEDLLACMTTANTKPTNGILPFAFKHALSKVDFKVKAGPDRKVYILSVAIKNVLSQGTLTFSGNDFTWGSNSTNANYTFSSNLNNEALYDGGAVGGAGTTTVLSPTGFTGSLMLMPQVNTPVWDKTVANLAAGAYVEVVYRMTDAAGTDKVGLKATAGNQRYVKVGFPLATLPLNLNWSKSTRYTYTITLGTDDSSNGILIDGKFIDPTGTTTGTTVTDPTGTTTPTPGQPVTPTDKAITLGVSISSWTETGGDLK